MPPKAVRRKDGENLGKSTPQSPGELPGGPGAGRKDDLSSGRASGGEDLAPGSEPSGADPPNYSHARILHWSNPFIVRALETVLAVTILAALLIADLPLKKTVWIHFAFSSPLIPIATLFGVAALYHRNPLDAVFTLILLVFCFVMYLLAAIQVVTHWREIKRNRAQSLPIWITVMQLTFVIVIALLTDIIWYIVLQKGTKNMDSTKKETLVDKRKKNLPKERKGSRNY